MAPEPGWLDSEGAPDSQSPDQPGNSPGHSASPRAARAQAQAQDATKDATKDATQDATQDQGGGQAPPGSPSGKTAAAPPGTAVRKGAKRKRPFWRELVVIIVAALVLTIVLKAFVVQVFSIPSQSMENTLVPGDRVLVNKLVYHFRSIARGDIVVFSGQGSWDPPAPPPSGNPLIRLWDDTTNLIGISAPGTDYIKRVIGIPGDHVACCDAQGRVTVNGVPLNEQSYIYPGNGTAQLRFVITVPPGRLWVMGDNRGDSDDSRYRMDEPGSGTIPESAVVGRAFVVIWPPSRLADLPIPATFEQAGLRAAAAAGSALPAAGGGGSAALAVGILGWRRRRSRRRPG